MGVFLFTLFLSFATAQAGDSCVVVTLPLPPERPPASPADRQNNAVRDGILYLVKTAVEPGEEISIQKDSVSIPYGALPKSHRGFFAELTGKDPHTIFDRLTSVEYSKLYLLMRGNLHPSFEIPTNREALEAHWGYRAARFRDGPPNTWVNDESGFWMRKIIPVSLAKGKQRTLYRARAAHPLLKTATLKISIAETIDETEVALLREDGSGDWDYFGYDRKGNLTLTSTFATTPHLTNTALTPHACMACHYNSSIRKFKGTK